MAAQSFKSLNNKDIVTQRELLYEVIPITGSIVSGTYGQSNTATEFPNEGNIKNFTHGMFQSVYDYPYLSSSANHIFDITVGYSTSSQWEHHNTNIAEGENVQNAVKLNIYNQMAQVLVGHDHTGSIKPFKIPAGDQIDVAYFINFSRLLVKDEIKKGSFSISFGTGSNFSPAVGGQSAHDYGGSPRTLVDYGATTYYTDSPAGDYAILTMSADPPAYELGGKPAGLIYYQAGIIVLSASMFYPLDITKHNGVAGDGSAIAATSTIIVKTTNPGQLRGMEFTLMSADASFTSKTYYLHDALHDDYATGANDHPSYSGKILIDTKGLSTEATIAAQIQAAIAHSNGHTNTKLTTALSTTTAANDTITITQYVAGFASNLPVSAVTNGNASYMTINGGIAASMFAGGSGGKDLDGYLLMYGSGYGHIKEENDHTFRQLLVSSSISGTANALRHRIDNIEFQNTTELNSTIHFCRLNNNEFNYSANPTYLSESKIQVKGDNKFTKPVSYVTTVGLYGSDNALLAVAKLSRPVKKTTSNELTLRVRLDY